MNKFGITGLEVVVHTNGKIDRYFPVMGFGVNAESFMLEISWIAGLDESEPKDKTKSESTPQIRSYNSGQWDLVEIRS